MATHPFRWAAARRVTPQALVGCHFSIVQRRPSITGPLHFLEGLPFLGQLPRVGRGLSMGQKAQELH